MIREFELTVNEEEEMKETQSPLFNIFYAAAHTENEPCYQHINFDKVPCET